MSPRLLHVPDLGGPAARGAAVRPDGFAVPVDSRLAPVAVSRAPQASDQRCSVGRGGSRRRPVHLTSQTAQRRFRSMPVRVGINGFGRIGRQSLKALIERTPGRRGRRRQRHRRRADQRPPVQARLDLRRLPGRGHATRTTRSSSTAARSSVLQVADPATAPLEGPGRRHRHRVDRPLHRRRQGPRAPRRRREEGPHQRPGEEGGRHDRPRRQRRRLRPGEAPHHQQRQLHHELPGAGGQGRPRRLDDQARPDEHDPLVHERPADPRRRPQGSPARPRGRPEHHPDHDRRREGPGPRDPRPQGQVRRLQPARPDAHRLGRRLHGRARAATPRSRSSTRPSAPPPPAR